ncbi:MAG: agmatine deiminase family protein [Desulfuromonadaceae bacterium]|nr:agmatine deiminase family protein [Desulfuromonadaceae bacterium]
MTQKTNPQISTDTNLTAYATPRDQKHLVRLPAEWEPQDGVLLAWPCPGSDWDPILPEIEAVLVDIIRHTIAFENIIIVAPELQRTASILQKHGLNSASIRLFEIDNNDTWARDFGPIGVEIDAKLHLLDFGFNGWGLKFPADLDNQINKNLAAAGAWKVPLLTQGLILEGGSIESDGKGTLLTTTECLLSPNRNPHLSKQALESRLKETFGATQILWLNHGALVGDDTDGHIDTLARLCPNDTIAYVRCDDPADEHFETMQALEQELRLFKTLQGRNYTLVALPWPQPAFDHNQQRLPATYANFLVINGAVLVPTYADPADAEALRIIGTVYPGRKIIGIDCSSVILQHGSLHCLTMQLPEGTLA